MVTCKSCFSTQNLVNCRICDAPICMKHRSEYFGPINDFVCEDCRHEQVKNKISYSVNKPTQVRIEEQSMKCQICKKKNYEIVHLSETFSTVGTKFCNECFAVLQSDAYNLLVEEYNRLCDYIDTIPDNSCGCIHGNWIDYKKKPVHKTGLETIKKLRDALTETQDKHDELLEENKRLRNIFGLSQKIITI